MVPPAFKGGQDSRRFKGKLMSERDRRFAERPDPPPPEDAELSRRLRDLDRRLTESQAAVDDGASRVDAPPPAGTATALRMGADFVAAIALGAALGWGFDRLFGTSPWGMIVLLLLGFAAGVLGAMRSAGLVKQAPWSERRK
jgi:ATP synthase protein I